MTTSPDSIFSFISSAFSDAAFSIAVGLINSITALGSPLASTAALTCAFNSVATAKAAIESSEVKSVTSVIFVFTLLTAASSCVLTASKSSFAAIPVSSIFAATFAVTWAISLVFERSRTGASLSGFAFATSAFSFTISTTVSSATENAEALSAPADSTAVETALIVVITC